MMTGAAWIHAAALYWISMARQDINAPKCAKKAKDYCKDAKINARENLMIQITIQWIYEPSNSYMIPYQNNSLNHAFAKNGITFHIGQNSVIISIKNRIKKNQSDSVSQRSNEMFWNGSHFVVELCPEPDYRSITVVLRRYENHSRRRQHQTFYRDNVSKTFFPCEKPCFSVKCLP